jgi:ribosomal protein L11 methyltransferase
MPSWTVLQLDLPADLEDLASAVLQDLGSLGWETRRRGKDVRLLAYWPEPPPAGLVEDLAGRLDTLAARAGTPRPPRPVPARIPEKDWEAVWRAHFRLERPLPDLVIRPSWISYEPGPRETVIVIDPKMAFGVGGHPTTRLCLRLLRQVPRLGRMLDVGTGTGILAIAAARWGARRVVAVERDGAAVANARENLARNRVEDQVWLARGSVNAVRGTFDVIAANMLLAELRAVIPELAGRMRPAGCVILSGFLTSDEHTLRARLSEHGFGWMAGARDGEWGALAARRKGTGLSGG